MNDALARADAARRSYEAPWGVVDAVKEASCEVLAGDAVALVGPSGSGKTTLLHLLAGLDRPSGGTVDWPALGDPPHPPVGSVAVAFQGPSLIPALTVAENTALPALLAGRSAQSADVAARSALELFGVEDVAGHLPEEISGGQALRAGLARAIVTEPALILADEPTGQLDGETAGATMRTLLAWCADHGTGLVVATHDEAVAGRLELRWAMDDGVLRTEVPSRSA